MTTRPWWQFHWVTWLALFAVGGVLLYMQFHDTRDRGWPFVGYWGWPPGTTSEHRYWPASAVTDIAISIAILGSTAYCFEQIVRRRFRISLSSLFVLVAAIAAAFSVAGWEHSIYAIADQKVIIYEPGWPEVVSTAWAPLAIRIVLWSGIACAFYTIASCIVRGTLWTARRMTRKSLPVPRP